MQHRADMSWTRLGLIAAGGLATTACLVSYVAAANSNPVRLAAAPTVVAPAKMDAAATKLSVPPMPVPSDERIATSSRLISESLTIAEQHSNLYDNVARQAAARGAAALLPRLQGTVRQKLTDRWIAIVMSSSVPRPQREAAFDSFFYAAAREDVDFANSVALGLPDAAARSGAFLQMSEAEDLHDWTRANNFVLLAQRAARQEGDLVYRATALTFIAARLAVLNPESQEDALHEASVEDRQIRNVDQRDALLTEIVGAASHFDLPLAKKITGDIQNEHLRDLAQARVNIAEASSTTLTSSTADRVAALAKAAARYDIRAVPILLQLPPQNEVLHAIGDALPPIYPNAQPAISTGLLERIWNFSAKAQPSVYRDQLQSRVARLMVLKDLWRGRSWGKQLTWKGGRIQVGAFLKAVIEARRSQLQAMPLQDLAERSIQRAIAEAHQLPPAEQAEALLLIAGQILG